MTKVVSINGAALVRRTHVEQTLALLTARKAVRAQWLAQGKHRYNSFSVAELRQAGEFYLFDHPEIFDKVAAMIAHDPVLTKMAELERKRACKYLK